MLGEKSFNTEDVQEFDMKAIEAKMTPEQLAAYQEAKKKDREPPANSEIGQKDKKQRALEAVKLQEERNRKQEQSDREFICNSLAEAMETKNPQMLDTLLSQYLKDQTAFAPLRDVSELQSVLDTLAFKEPDTGDMDLNKEPKMLMNTAYLEIPFANGDVKQVAVTVKAVSYYEDQGPVVSFQASEIPKKVEQQVQSAAPEKNSPIKPQEKSGGFLKRIGKIFTGK